MTKTAVNRGSFKGPKGDTGATGSTGPKGDAGAQGTQGPKGDTGAAGADATAIYGGKGAANGVAPLNGNADVPIANLPTASSGTSSATAVPLANDSRLFRQVTQIRANANQAIGTANTWYNVVFQVEDYDDENLHSTSSNTDRITFARPGRYRVSGTAMWTGGITANGVRGVHLCIGGTQVPGGQNLAPYLANNYCSHNVTPVYITITQAQINNGTAYLQMQVYSSTANSNLFGAAADGCVMTVEYIGDAA